MATEIYAELVLSGDPLPIDKLTELLETAPARVVRKGELRRPASPKPSDCDLWEIRTELCAGLDLPAHVLELLNRIREDNLRVLQREHGFEVQLNCVGYIDSDDTTGAGATPILHFEPQLIARLAYLSASLDVDLYVLGSETGR